MSMISRFRKGVKTNRRGLTTNEFDSQRYIERMKSLFYGSMPQIPEGVVEEIFYYYADQIDPDTDDLVSGFAGLEYVVELFYGEYTADRNDLNREELEMLKDVINEYALDLHQSLVQEIMALLVEKGLF